MRKSRLVAAAAVGFVALLSIGTSIPAGPVAPLPQSGAASRTGQQLYLAHGCYQCHGYAGQGGAGPRLIPLRLGSSDFAAYVRNPRGIMPAYSRNAINDADLAMIHAYVASFPKPRAAADIPLLKTLLDAPASYRGSPRGKARAPTGTAPVPAARATAEKQLDSARGGELYLANCAACHGEARQGGVGPALLSEPGKRDMEGTIRLIQNPPPSMPRLFPESLSAAEVKEIAIFIRSAGQ